MCWKQVGVSCLETFLFAFAKSHGAAPGQQHPTNAHLWPCQCKCSAAALPLHCCRPRQAEPETRFRAWPQNADRQKHGSSALTRLTWGRRDMHARRSGCISSGQYWLQLNSFRPAWNLHRSSACLLEKWHANTTIITSVPVAKKHKDHLRASFHASCKSAQSLSAKECSLPQSYFFKIRHCCIILLRRRILGMCHNEEGKKRKEYQFASVPLEWHHQWWKFYIDRSLKENTVWQRYGEPSCQSYERVSALISRETKKGIERV